jgi:hypothetical protein
MNSASLCSLAGRYENPIPPRCLAPIDFLKIPAQLQDYDGIDSRISLCVSFFRSASRFDRSGSRISLRVSFLNLLQDYNGIGSRISLCVSFLDMHWKRFLDLRLCVLSRSEPVFVKVYGAQNRFRGIDAASLCCLAGRYNIQGCRTGPPGWESISGLLKGSTNTSSAQRLRWNRFPGFPSLCLFSRTALYL